MLTALIADSRLSDDEFDALKAEIDRVRGEHWDAVSIRRCRNAPVVPVEGRGAGASQSPDRQAWIVEGRGVARSGTIAKPALFETAATAQKWTSGYWIH